jgi:hypothetical protein
MKMLARSASWALIAAIVLLFVAIMQHSSRAADAPARVTTSFELKHTEAVLKRVSKVFSAGFDRAEAERLAREIAAMAADTPKSWNYATLYKGLSQPLQVKALVDDLGMVDLDFATSAEVAPSVRAAVDGYLNSRNL